MKKSILLIFATFLEAEATLASHPYETLIPDTLYRFSDTYLLITGMGPSPAAQKTTLYAPTASCIYNFGIAGSLHSHHTLFSWHTVSVVTHHATKKSFILSKTPGSRLLTLDTPLYDEQLRNSLQTHYDLVDMEGFAIAEAASYLNIPTYLHKIVSDFCSSSTSDTIRLHIKTLSQKIADKIDEMKLI